MNRERDVDLKRTYRTLSFVWSAMLGALSIYVALVIFFGNQVDVGFQRPSLVIAIVVQPFYAYRFSRFFWPSPYAGLFFGNKVVPTTRL